MSRDEYKAIIINMLQDSVIDDYIIEHIADKCVAIDKLVQDGNNSLYHHLISTQVIALIVYDYLQGL